MSEKQQIYLAAFVGSSIGEITPGLFGAGIFSLWGLLGGFVGGLIGIWLAWRYLHG